MGQKDQFWISTTVACGLGAMLVYGIFDFNKINYRRLCERVETAADANMDGETSIDEWKDVYRKLGIRFNALKPKELSKEEMKRYLDINNPQKP